MSVKSLITQVESKHSEYLHSLLRYDRFRTTETLAEWVRLLGPDVLAATHPYFTQEIVEQFITKQNEETVTINESDARLLLTTALVHDWGEIMIDDQGVGDISFDQKSIVHEDTEISIFDRICSELPEGPDLDYIKQAYTIVQQKEGLGEMFNVVERVGYLVTALRAYEGIDDKRIANWKGLVGNVLSNQIIKLSEYALKYAYVEQILTSNAEKITSAYQEITDLAIAPLDKAGKASYDQVRLTMSQETWKTFLQSNSQTA